MTSTHAGTGAPARDRADTNASFADAQQLELLAQAAEMLCEMPRHAFVTCHMSSPMLATTASPTPRCVSPFELWSAQRSCEAPCSGAPAGAPPAGAPPAGVPPGAYAPPQLRSRELSDESTHIVSSVMLTPPPKGVAAPAGASAQPGPQPASVGSPFALPGARHAAAPEPCATAAWQPHAQPERLPAHPTQPPPRDEHDDDDGECALDDGDDGGWFSRAAHADADADADADMEGKAEGSHTPLRRTAPWTRTEDELKSASRMREEAPSTGAATSHAVIAPHGAPSHGGSAGADDERADGASARELPARARSVEGASDGAARAWCGASRAESAAAAPLGFRPIAGACTNASVSPDGMAAPARCERAIGAHDGGDARTEAAAVPAQLDALARAPATPAPHGRGGASRRGCGGGSGAGGGYKCSRCGQPKRGHLCTGDRNESDRAAYEAAQLRMRTLLLQQAESAPPVAAARLPKRHKPAW
ncbi:hypothetical protein KFE25_010923 [Diacronema lutheri]|uniref:Uncharacterized protein n=1 Tax=Diacronema lutheri TaxID=2081491 RepID=A0A8J6CAV7_DIALT|nr:hypothetical protein KFE25_010923 [Diacronema lutheri]